ncbi:MAG: paraquat-inducible protein A [Rhizobiaceae bacterium]|nr:paraquat-inducible protein A [Rhizobiaceae bacterium]
MPLLLPIVLFLATFCFALGIALPLIRVDRLFLFSDEPSLVGIVRGLFDDGDVLLAAVIALVSIVCPALKLGLLHVASYATSTARVPGWFRTLSNWSMLDVVLVALVVFAAKTSGVATAFTRPGLWFFAASAVLTAAASGLAKRRDEQS